MRLDLLEEKVEEIKRLKAIEREEYEIKAITELKFKPDKKKCLRNIQATVTWQIDNSTSIEPYKNIKDCKQLDIYLEEHPKWIELIEAWEVVDKAKDIIKDPETEEVEE